MIKNKGPEKSPLFFSYGNTLARRKMSQMSSKLSRRSITRKCIVFIISDTLTPPLNLICPDPVALNIYTIDLSGNPGYACFVMFRMILVMIYLMV